MYKISVPLMLSTINDNNREKYIELCKRAGASRVFLALQDNTIPDNLKENIDSFKKCGFEVGVWMSTIGHDFAFSHTLDIETQSDFDGIVDIEGNGFPHAHCPFSEKFRSFISRFIADVAKLKPDIVMLDDDFRLSQHGENLCCACSLHIERIGNILGEKITREQIKPYVITGESNKYRNAWLQAQNESLAELAQCIRAEVDKESSDVCVCFCSAFCIWNADGIDVPELVRILAGKNQRILRLTGAPYWATGIRRTYPLISVFEIARMLASFVQEEGFELMCEGDVYPRPRYTCPASYLEMYDAVNRISGGYNGILKYMFDYVAGPDFETAYLEFHEKNQPFYNWLENAFPNGANAGVRIVVQPHTLAEANLDFSPPRTYSPVPLDGTMLGQCGIPTVYGKKGICNSLFGENARSFSLDELDTGTILDAVSARILSERGVDVGIQSKGEFVQETIRYLSSNDPESKPTITNGEVRVLDALLCDRAEPLLYATGINRTIPFAYRYENADGQRFLVFMLEAACIYDYKKSIALSGLTKNYATQEVLINTVPWLSRQPLPAYCAKNPELYLMCEKNDGSLSVALFNCFADAVMNPVIMLDKEYSNIECMNCEAKIEGSKVILTNTLHAFSMAAFRVYD